MRLNQKYVLLVDDDENIRDIVTQVLEMDGYIVIAVRNGVEALAQLKSSTELPSLILLDLNMPGMDGWQFLAAKKTDSDFDDIPVVLSSASEPKPNPALFVDAILRKPFDVNQLTNMVERFLHPVSAEPPLGAKLHSTSHP